MTEINKPCKQWRITHDFKPTPFNAANNYTVYYTLRFAVPDYSHVHNMLIDEHVMDICFTTRTTYITNRSPWPDATHSICEVPKIGEWTTIDIINEELEPGKSTLTVLFGGRQVFQIGQAGPCDLNTAKVYYPASHLHHPGYIRNLSIMTM